MRDKFKVIYSIDAPLGGVGIGSLAYHAIKGIEKENLIKEIYCSGVVKKNLRSKIISFSFLSKLSLVLRAIQKKLYSRFNANKYLITIFDFLVSKKISECEIFHGWNGYAMKSAIKAKKLGSKVIIECASTHPAYQKKEIIEEYQKYGVDLNLLTPKKFIEDSRKLFALADYVIIPSDYVEKTFLSEGYPKNKLIKIPFGVDIKKFVPNNKKKDKRFRAIFVGSIQLRKGLQYLLQTWKELNLKNAELIVVGRIWPDAKKMMKKYSKVKGVVYKGFDKDLKKYYSESDVFIFPSLEEGSALVSYEAMASGLPLITTPNTGSIMRDKKDGFIIPTRNVEKLKEKIRFFYDNPKEIEKMGKSARKYVEKFTWENYGENLVKEYKKILFE